jgi:hypothetical protein
VGGAAQGRSVGLSADGNTAIVGGPADDVRSPLYHSTSVGAAWVFTRSAGVWTQQGAKLIGTGADGGARQGFSVGLSGDGNTAMVGGPYDAGPLGPGAIGAVWLFTRSGGVWSQLGGKLTGTGLVTGAALGYSVALSADGKTALAGGPLDNGDVGATWVFTLPAAAPRAKTDFNADGAADILFSDGGAMGNWLYFMNGASVLSSQPLSSAAPGWVLAGVGDFNGDGHADLLWKNTADPTQYWIYLMNGTTVIGGGPLTVAAGYAPTQIADFNGDGNADIVWENGSGGRWIYFMNGASVLSVQPVPSTAPGWVIAGVGDFNGDGKADILWQNSAAPTQYWIYLMNGSSVIGGGGFMVADGYYQTQIADFDGDLKSDILFENGTTSRWMYFMSGASVTSAAPAPTAAPGWNVVGTGDFNGDHRADLLWQDSADPTQYWIYLLNGASTIGGGGFMTAPGYVPVVH